MQVAHYNNPKQSKKQYLKKKKRQIKRNEHNLHFRQALNINKKGT